MDNPVLSSQDVQSVLSTDVAVRHVGIIDHQARQIVIWIQDVWVFRNFWQTGSLQAPIDHEQIEISHVLPRQEGFARGLWALAKIQFARNDETPMHPGSE